MLEKKHFNKIQIRHLVYTTIFSQHHSEPTYLNGSQDLPEAGPLSRPTCTARRISLKLDLWAHLPERLAGSPWSWTSAACGPSWPRTCATLWTAGGETHKDSACCHSETPVDRKTIHIDVLTQMVHNTAILLLTNEEKYMFLPPAPIHSKFSFNFNVWIPELVMLDINKLKPKLLVSPLSTQSDKQVK